MLSLYLPGDSWVHRLPIAIKLFVVLSLALTVSLIHPSWVVLGIITALIAGCYLTSIGGKQLLAQVFRLRILLLIILIPQLIFRDAQTAAHNTARIVLVVLAASLLTLTTRTSALLGALTKLMTPLRWVGVDPERPALLFLLTMTTIPTIGGLRQQLQESYRARGRLFMSPAAITGLLVLTMKHADQLAEALEARGLEQ